MPRTPRSQTPDLGPLLAAGPTPFAGLSPEAGEALLSAAARHGLLSAAVGALPPDHPRLAERCRRLVAAARLQDARLRQVLEEVLALLAAVGVVPVALKGPVLADRIYPDPSLRASSDLDLLVGEEELERAVAALLGAGFGRADPLVDAYQRRHHHHLHLHRSPGPDVELHFRPQSACGARLPAAALLTRALPHRTSRGTPLRVLAPEDELLTLGLHAAGHLLERAGWLLDLVLFARSHPALDWQAVAARAADFRCRRALGYALARARELGAPIPELPGLGLDGGRRALCARLSRAALARDDRLGTALRMAFQLVLRDRPLEVPGVVATEAGWVVRRRAHLLARRLTRSRARHSILGPK